MSFVSFSLAVSFIIRFQCWFDFISYDHYTFGSKILNNLVSQHYKSLVGHVPSRFISMAFCA